MPQRWLRDRLPNRTQMQKQLGLLPDCALTEQHTWLQRTLAEPMLWHLNRRSVAGAVAVGLFVAWLPVPLQMLLAAVLAAALRVHVPVSVIMVWFSNPLTTPPLLYAAWYVGSTLFGLSGGNEPMVFTITGLLSGAASAWPAIVAGSIFCGSLFAVIGYAFTQILWRYIAVKRWRRRSVA